MQRAVRYAGDEANEELEMSCKGICIRHKATRSHHDGGNRYSTGQKRCQICQSHKMGRIMVSMLWLQTKNEVTQLKIRTEIKNEKKESGI